MNRLGKGLLGGLAAGCLLSGCGSPDQSLRQKQRVVLPRPADTAPDLLVPERRVGRLLRSLLTAYEASDWAGANRAFVRGSAARSLVDQFQTWKDEGVGGLHARLVYLRRLDSRRFEGTVEFLSDPRAIPVYGIYVFQDSHGALRIRGTSTGLNGTSYLNADWQVTRTAHYRIYHSHFQLQGDDRRFLTRLESERTQFIRWFGIRPPPVADYYLYPDQATLFSLTKGLCGKSPNIVGCMRQGPRPPQIQTSEWPSYHEPIHVFQLSMEPAGYQAPLFVAEGMAVALEDRDVDPKLSDYCSDLAYTPLDTCAARVADTVRPLDLLADAGFASGDVQASYLVAGSFAKYLMLKYGYHRYARFYYLLAAQPTDRISDYNVATERIYRRSVEGLLADWHRALCPNGCR
jgi:hypothetical protein